MVGFDLSSRVAHGVGESFSRDGEWKEEGGCRMEADIQWLIFLGQ